jgi:hypothetical protein
MRQTGLLHASMLVMPFYPPYLNPIPVIFDKGFLSVVHQKTLAILTPTIQPPATPNPNYWGLALRLQVFGETRED